VYDISTVRTLVVDDSAPWRDFIIAWLQEARVQAIDSASDGLEAVQKAQQQPPDLVLMDIGLPKLSGLEAARQILACAPTCTILFVSNNENLETIRAAFRTGGRGYVLKSSVHGDLREGIEVVLRGRRFVGRGLSGDTLADPGEL
jgi:DNA-binding NarL/FixJ family response regulator